MRTLQELQIGKDVAEMFGVASAAPADLHPGRVRNDQRRFAQKRLHESREQNLPHDRRGEIAVRLLDKKTIAVLVLLAPIGEVILSETRAFDLRRIIVERARLTDEIERDVRKGDILLDHRRM